MTGTLRALVCGAALVVAVGAQTPRPQVRAVEDVRIAFETENGVARLHPFSGVPFTLDLRALSFSLRPFNAFRLDPSASPQPIAVELGRPVPQNYPGRYEYIIPITVPAPAGPGMYRLSADALPGFARDAGGNVLPSRRFPKSGIGAIAAWWPDERGGDSGLRDVRTRFSMRAVRTYGGIGLVCPSWGTSTNPLVAIGVGTVTREVGRVEELETGATWDAQDFGFRFLAFDPLAFPVVDPHVSPPPLPNVQPCDFVLRFADPWHVDTSLTTAQPPRDLAGKIELGMSRDDVIWRAGFPNAYGTVASFRARDFWYYDAPTPFSWWVRFANDRVVEYHPPGNLP